MILRGRMRTERRASEYARLLRSILEAHMPTNFVLAELGPITTHITRRGT
jgi:hypothetical protein